jgi:hypothetical protein
LEGHIRSLALIIATWVEEGDGENGKRRLPDMLLPVVRRRSSDLTAMFDERPGCCREEGAASAQRKDRVGFPLPKFNHKLFLVKLGPLGVPQCQLGEVDKYDTIFL